MNPEEPLPLVLPEEFRVFTAGWKSFVATLPPNLYARLAARAESEEMPLALEAAYLLTYALDNAPRPSEAHLDPLTEQEREEALRVRRHVAALAVGSKIEGDNVPLGDDDEFTPYGGANWTR